MKSWSRQTVDAPLTSGVAKAGPIMNAISREARASALAELEEQEGGRDHVIATTNWHSKLNKYGYKWHYE